MSAGHLYDGVSESDDLDIQDSEGSAKNPASQPHKDGGPNSSHVIRQLGLNLQPCLPFARDRSRSKGFLMSLQRGMAWRGAQAVCLHLPVAVAAHGDMMRVTACSTASRKPPEKNWQKQSANWLRQRTGRRKQDSNQLCRCRPATATASPDRQEGFRQYTQAGT